MKKLFGLCMLFAVMFMGTSAFAYEGGEKGEKMKGGSHHEIVLEAVEADDYSLLPEEVQERMTEEKFDEMVTYYNENGTLPTKQKKGMKDGEEKSENGMKTKKKRKYFSAKHKGSVEKIVERLDVEKLEKILEKIEKKIEMLESNEEMNADKKEMILDYLDGIKVVIETALAAE